MAGTDEYGTFSALIDQAIAKAGRGPAARTEMVSYVRSSMREAQTEALFDNDMVEETVTATANPHIWDVPSNFRVMLTVEYPAVPVFPDFRPPGKRQQFETDYFYYRSANSFVFAQLEIGDIINLAYYKYFKPLTYFAEAARPARYFADLGKWQYLDGNGNFVDNLASTALEEAARDLVSNWLLFDWFDLVKEGSLAKIFKMNGDERAGSTFALFKSMINDLLQGESYASLNQ